MGEETPASPAPAGRVGVRDVARAAGVSPQTVSRVLNGHASIRDDTRARVREAVSALGYRMNNTARAFGTATTRTLGVVASAAALYGPSAGIAAVETAARARGRWVATAYADAADAASVVAAVQHLLSQGVDGIVLVAAHALTREAVAQAGPGVPVVALHDGSGAERQQEGAALAVQHLLDVGHRRIAELRGPEDWTEAAARSRGVASALAAAGLTVSASWTGDWSAAAGFAVAPAVVAAVARGGGPTAVVAANDQMALGLVAGLRAQGVEVPGEVSVAGFDDNPDAAFYRPALTTVRLDLAGEARRVVADVIGESTEPPSAPLLVERASTAPPRH
ncbi:LacI family transcriptional regulator [Microbacterium lushaniae]|nr:LacI family transcriptional regulator [Microbacterium lushaniae]KAA9157675.1 LacI family transcriptional regulator [Microbacterium lushaniae]